MGVKRTLQYLTVSSHKIIMNHAWSNLWSQNSSSEVISVVVPDVA